MYYHTTDYHNLFSVLLRKMKFSLRSFFESPRETRAFRDLMRNPPKSWVWLGTGNNGRTTMMKQYFPKYYRMPTRNNKSEVYLWRDKTIVIKDVLCPGCYDGTTGPNVTIFSKKF
jgi:hypothetical protein